MAAIIQPMLCEPLEDAFRAANLEALGLPRLSIERVERAKGRGNITFLSDLTPVLRIDDHYLDVPRDEDLIRNVAFDSAAEKKAIAVFGLGLGHTIRTLRCYCDCPIIVYEPDIGLLRTALDYGPLELGDVTVTTSLHEFGQAWPSATHKRTAASILATPGYDEYLPAERAEFDKNVRQLIHRTGANEATYRQRAQDWSRHLVHNVSTLTESPIAQSLAGALRDVPAFIVGAGPSLAQNGELLRLAAQKGVIFAANSSGKALAKLEVEPQFLGCMESMDVSHLLRDLPFISRVIRLLSITAHPNTYDMTDGPILPFFEAVSQIGIPMSELTGARGITVCTSISTAMFSLAELMGCNPIILVGQDLGYTGGRAYAPGTPYEDTRAAVSDDGKRIELRWCETLRATHRHGKAVAGPAVTAEPLRYVPAWGGEGEVATITNFDAVRSWLEAASQVLGEARPELQLINATEGGSRVNGFEEQRLADLLTPMRDWNLTANDLFELACTRKGPVGPIAVREWATRQRQANERIRRGARHLRRVAAVAQRAIGADDPTRVGTAFAALTVAEKRLSESVARAPLVDAWSFASVDALTKSREANPFSDARTSAAEATKTEIEVANAVEAAARELDAELTRVGAREHEVPGVPEHQER